MRVLTLLNREDSESEGVGFYRYRLTFEFLALRMGLNLPDGHPGLMYPNMQYQHGLEDGRRPHVSLKHWTETNYLGAVVKTKQYFLQGREAVDVRETHDFPNRMFWRSPSPTRREL